MVKRCTNPHTKGWENYGGRGITVCDKWMKFAGFMEDMLPIYEEHLTIDRIDNDKGYYKENCRWSTQKEQMRNVRKSVFIDTEWGRITLAEAAERSGLSYQTIHTRLKSGVPEENLLDPAGTVKYYSATK